MSRILQLTEQGWDDFVRSGAALAGFWADWCIPSQSLELLLQAVERDFDGRVRVALANYDENPGLVHRYRIEGLPTVLLFRDGAEIRRRVGLVDRAALHALIREALG